MSKFKVGDKVRVRNDLKVGEIYGGDRFVNYMTKYKGKIYSILKKQGNEYILEIRDDTDWFFTDEMLEPVENTDYANSLIQELIENNKSLFDKVILNYTIIPKPQILDDVEKEYLRNVIKPFRDRIVGIFKDRLHDNKVECIRIVVRSIVYDSTHINLPFFRTNAMYKGMKPNRYYTIEELGL